MKANFLKTKSILANVTLLLFSMLLLTNCAKRDEETSSSEIVGNWKLSKILVKGTSQGITSETVITGNATMDLKADKTYTSTFLGGTYSITIPGIGTPITGNVPAGNGSGTYEYNPTTKILKATGSVSGYGSSSGEANVTELTSNSLKFNTYSSGNEGGVSGSGTAYYEYTR